MAAVPVGTAASVHMSKEVSGRDLLEDLPLQPDGKRYYISGIELGQNGESRVPRAKLRTVGYHTTGSNGMGWLWWPGHGSVGEEQFDWIPFAVVRALAGKPLLLKDLLAAVERPEKETREAVTTLVEQGLVSRRQNRFALTFPVFTSDDTLILLPVLKDVVAPAMERVLRPGSAKIEGLLAELGYGRFDRLLRDVRFCLTQNDVRGWALLRLVELGALAEPPFEDSPDWNTFGWIGQTGTIFWQCG